jgi:hypothetical protein
MRVWGWVLLAIGLFFLVAFALAQAGGAQLGLLPWIISIFLTISGFNMLRSGRGIVRATPATTTNAVATMADAVATPSGESTTSAIAAGTVEVPMSPGAAAAIKLTSRRRIMIPTYLGAGFFVFWVLVGAAFAIFDQTPGEGATFFGTFALIGVATGVLIIGISYLTARGAMTDATGTTCLRTTGPIQVAPGTIGGPILQLADRAFMIDARTEAPALRALAQGTVEYSPRGHVIVAAWNAEGRNVYTARGYEPGPGTLNA